MTEPKTPRPTIRLNKSEVEGLVPDMERDYFAKVHGFQGLCVRVMPSGARSFVMRYRFNGKPDKHVLGQYPSMTPEVAKKAHTKAWSMIHNGINPSASRTAAREAERAAVTVARLAERFITDHMEAKNKPSTQLVNSRYIKADIIPRLGSLKVKDLTKADVAEFLFAFQAEGKKGKAYTLSRILSKMFAKAELWGLRSEGTNPARGQECEQPTKRARRLSDAEMFRLGRILRESTDSPYAVRAFRLYLLTGMRRSELLGDERLGIKPLTWEGVNHVDFARGVIHLEEHKTAGKAGPRDLVVCQAAQVELEALHQLRMVGNPCVIPGTEPGKPMVNLHEVWKRTRTKAQLPDVTIHDLRRSFVSMGADLGLPDYFADAQTGHAAATVTDIYRRVGLNPLRDAVEAIGARIAGLLDGTIDPAKEAAERAKAEAEKAGKRA